LGSFQNSFGIGGVPSWEATSFLKVALGNIGQILLKAT